MNIGKFLLAGMVVLGLAAPAAADDPALPPNVDVKQLQLLAAFMKTDNFRQYANAAFNDFEVPPLKAECGQLQLTDATLLSWDKQPRFEEKDGRMSLVEGSWVVLGTMDRCGKPAKRRALFTVKGPGSLAPLPLIPGDFFGDLLLEIDARKIVMPGLLAEAPCSDLKQFYFLDVVRLDPPLSYKPPSPPGWKEEWQVEACGKRESVTVEYVHIGGGINISANFPAGAFGKKP